MSFNCFHLLLLSFLFGHLNYCLSNYQFHNYGTFDRTPSSKGGWRRCSCLSHPHRIVLSYLLIFTSPLIWPGIKSYKLIHFKMSPESTSQSSTDIQIVNSFLFSPEKNMNATTVNNFVISKCCWWVMWKRRGSLIFCPHTPPSASCNYE